MVAPDFSSKDIETLSKRAALRCSNPECLKLTTGPNSDPAKITNIGEAAHIFGSRPGSARHDIAMSDQERATISNAIWLCKDCHGLADRDPIRYPASVLLIWKERHERRNIQEIGLSNESIRLEIFEQEIAELREIPAFSKQLIRDRPLHWEYMLTAELLDFYLKPALTKADDLRRGVYTKPMTRVPDPEISEWIKQRSHELRNAVAAANNLFLPLVESWGAPDQPSESSKIVHYCKLYGDCAQRLADIAEQARFTNFSAGLEEICRHTMICALYPLNHFAELSKLVRSSLSQGGLLESAIIFELPRNWTAHFETLINRAKKRVYGIL